MLVDDGVDVVSRVSGVDAVEVFCLAPPSARFHFRPVPFSGGRNRKGAVGGPEAAVLRRRRGGGYPSSGLLSSGGGILGG